MMSKASKNEIKKGHRVWYKGGFGGDEALPGRYDGRDTKDGEDIFFVKLDNGDERWGYRDQFDFMGRVVS
jgi:hypothetical protein